MKEARLVAVLGYSDGSRGLHPVCAERLERAAGVAAPGDAVLLSGRARRPSTESEAELMARAWRGAARRVLLDRDARSTYGNARGAAATALELGVQDVVLVTSGWHARRAYTLLRAALRGTGLEVQLAPTGERGTLRSRLRELACWPIVPLQAALVGSRARGQARRA
ncbi:MAG TPA: YdcF family protein [Gaiellaceae bacterium]|nr:YdcF family protein [Gaiellaceae bacterium]